MSHGAKRYLCRGSASLSRYRHACAHFVSTGRITQQIATPAQNSPAIAEGVSRLFIKRFAIRSARSALNFFTVVIPL